MGKGEDYRAFLEAKVRFDHGCGFTVDERELNPSLAPHTRAMVRWALAGGRRALFASFGLHKTCAQLEIMRLIGVRRPGIRLIVLPLGVRQEFMIDARERFGPEHAITVKFIRRAGEIDDDRTIYLSNYESVREGILDIAALDPVAVSLDEAAVLRGFGGTKTFRESMAVFAGDDRRDKANRVQNDGVPFRFVATATPDPNEHIELLAYAAFLGIMDVGQAKTRFFKRNSEKADQLTLHPHKTREFWCWVASWALFIQKPSDLCDCTCHEEKRLSASASGGSSSSSGFRARSATAHGDAAAIAETNGSQHQIICSPGESLAAAVCAQSTEARGREPTPPGAACSSGSIEIGPHTVGEESRSASAGDHSRHSSPTWDNRRRARPSSESTTIADTSQETAAGRRAKNRPEIPAERCASHSAGDNSLSPPGPKNSESSTGPFTPATAPGGRPNECCNDSCPRCAELDLGYELPPLDVRWHELASDHAAAGTEKDGQARLFRAAAIGVQDAAAEKRHSLPARVDKLMQIRAEDPAAHRLIWHDLEAERAAIEQSIPTAVSVYGSQDLEERERAIIEFREGRIAELAGKPVMLGSGVNFQRFCSWAVFLGIGFKFSDFIQAIHRLQRFGQRRTVRIDILHTEAEREIKRELERRWRQHDEQVARMTALIREYGLSNAAMSQALRRTIGVERIEASGDRWRMVRNDCVAEAERLQPDSVGLIVTSIPFSHQYEYSPSYNDFGHTDDNAHFWRQMDFLTPQLLRVLQPGRVCAVHVKDRITPGGINGFGFQTVTRISDQCADHFERHGFAFLGRKTVVTDVVRENNQTYRLGWSEQCKDGSRMGAGLPEYVLLFRKAPTDRSNGYADVPVVKDKREYTRPRWQYDAHGFERSSGNRLLQPEDLEGLPQDVIFKRFRAHSLSTVYDFAHDVALAEGVDRSGWLPTTFMLMPPQSWHPDVWTDIARMRTLNSSQAQKGREMHLCPLQFDIVDRLIEQLSMRGETVFDPFAGIGTVPYCAVKLGRRGLGVELNAAYWADGAEYCKAAEAEVSMPTLFDLDEVAA